MHDRGLHLGDFPPSPKRVKAFWLDLTFAGQDRSEERYSGRVHMIQRQRIVDAILAGASPTLRERSERNGTRSKLRSVVTA